MERVYNTEIHEQDCVNKITEKLHLITPLTPLCSTVIAMEYSTLHGPLVSLSKRSNKRSISNACCESTCDCSSHSPVHTVVPAVHYCRHHWQQVVTVLTAPW